MPVMFSCEKCLNRVSSRRARFASWIFCVTRFTILIATGSPDTSSTAELYAPLRFSNTLYTHTDSHNIAISPATHLANELPPFLNMKDLPKR